VSAEDDIKQAFIQKFNYSDGKITLKRPRRLFLDTDLARFDEIFGYAVKELKFSHLASITGLDEGDVLSFIYHLCQESGIMLNLKLSVPKNNPVIKTVTGYFLSADIYERELADLFGAIVEGLKPDNRYPLPDDWPKGQYPLRKDWKKDV